MRVPAAILIVLIAVLLGIVGYCALNRERDRRSTTAPTKDFAAELVSSNGMVLVQSPGNPEWREVKTGAHFLEGDLVRTDSTGDAGIRYKGGAVVTIPQSTVFKVGRPGDTGMEITPSPNAVMPPLLTAGQSRISEEKAGRAPIELQQIIPFGRSLELIGRVEPGNRLSVNDEIVDLSGEGLFKHFTKPFPASVDIARLNLRITDLAGRTRIFSATHDFRSNSGRD